MEVEVVNVEVLRPGVVGSDRKCGQASRTGVAPWCVDREGAWVRRGGG